MLGAFPSPAARNAAAMENEFASERDKIEQAKTASEARLRDAEHQLDHLHAEDIGMELASGWADAVGTMADETRASQNRQKDLQVRIERQLALQADKDIQHARSASASAAAAAAAAVAAAEVERERAAADEKARVEAALREAEQQRLVPVRVKLSGFKMSQIKNKQAFEKAFAEKVRSTLDLDESQLRVLEISSGTG